MADNSTKFRFHSNFNAEAGFQSVKFGHDMPLLETELNELQILQEEARKSLVRRLVPSGFIEMVEKEFSGDAIIYNPAEKVNNRLNCIALAPSRAMINGTEVTLEGTYAIKGYDNYILIDLGEAPDSGTREDLVYLEVWFETLTANDVTTKWGYLNGASVGYPMIDARVADETSRRIAVKWDIKIAKGVRFNKYPDGFGYDNVNNFSPIYGRANGQLGYESNTKLIFANASNDMFKGCEFYKDNNLWVAGRPDYTFKSSSLFGQYIFALPLFRVKRRNKTAYSISNFNGSRTHIFTNTDTNSSVNGDLASNIRPDKLSYDFIDAQDLVDLRRSISVSEFSSEYYLNKGLKALFTGTLQTKDTKQTRRVQFGRAKIDYTQDDNAIMVVQYNDRTPTAMELPNATLPSCIYEGSTLQYRDSISGYGLFLNGNSLVKYSTSGINVDGGTIDFFLQPYWNGYDTSVNQTFLTLLDLNDNPIFTFEKRGSDLLWSQYTDVVSENTNGTVNQVIVDLTNKLMFAKSIYHIRLSWCNTSKINKSFIYINGNLAGDGTYGGSSLKPARLKVGKIEDIELDMGAVLEELVVYDCAFEQVISTGTYTYIDNQFWPSLPEDFIHGEALMYPSFNSLTRNFGDNQCVQTDTLIILDTDGEGTGEFTLNPPYQKKIIGTPKAYTLNGDANDDGIVETVPGTWTNVDDTWFFKADTTSLEQILVQYNIVIMPGNGGFDLPNEILAAGIVKDNSITEVSFSRKNKTDLRAVAYANPNRVSAAVDTAYDLSTKRDKNQCFARLLYYYKSGDGTNHYEIPSHLYGYPVIGIMNATNRKIVRIQRIPDTLTSNGRYVITLKDNVILGDVVQFQIALGGWTFDYETQTKSIVSNIHKVKMVEVTCDGLKNEFIVPCFENDGNGGIIKSVFAFTENIFGDTANPRKVTSQNKKYACYVNNEMLPNLPERDADGNLTGKNTYQLAEMIVDDTSFGTPFLKFRLSWTPAENVKLVIPVLISYQPTENEVLSVWYSHVPYQGMLSNSQKKLKRISDWKYFITTLGSGALSLNIHEDNFNSLNNIINRLPGGSSFAYIVDGQPIKLSHLASSLKSNTNSQLFFVKDIIFASDNNIFDDSFFELDTDFTISRLTAGFQDEKIIANFNDFKVYFPDCTEDITKYTGMACLVMDETGNLMLFVLSCLNNGLIDGTKSKENLLTPIYGDIYRIPGLPTSVQQY